ncbi:unnamed protein product [Pleuronectes platessa]|uniref:Uncharacterized protein n=1 Tax=Pleuronectes platessa TaxID=8262 RepID=A0A9N7URT0_PLEPL|nr:unnamed protein product [Pleuronectes platessa]
MEKENEKVLASGPKGDETAAGENSNYGTELQKGGGRDELEEREEVEKPPPSPFFYSSKQTPPLSPFIQGGILQCRLASFPFIPATVHRQPHPRNAALPGNDGQDDRNKSSPTSDFLRVVFLLLYF